MSSKYVWGIGGIIVGMFVIPMILGGTKKKAS